MHMGYTFLFFFFSVMTMFFEVLYSVFNQKSMRSGGKAGMEAARLPLEQFDVLLLDWIDCT